jgi:hypothetical protein
VATVVVAWTAALTFGANAPASQTPAGFSRAGSDHFNWRAYVWHAPATRVTGSAWLTPRSVMIQWSPTLTKASPSASLAVSDAWLWPRPRTEAPATFRSVSVSVGFPFRCLSGGWVYTAPIGSAPSFEARWSLPLLASPTAPPGATDWLRTTVLPLRPDPARFALNAIAYSAAFWVLWNGKLFYCGFIKRRRGGCPSCGYPTAGSARCPECGTTTGSRSA